MKTLAIILSVVIVIAFTAVIYTGAIYLAKFEEKRSNSYYENEENSRSFVRI